MFEVTHSAKLLICYSSSLAMRVVEFVFAVHIWLSVSLFVTAQPSCVSVHPQLILMVTIFLELFLWLLMYLYTS